MNFDDFIKLPLHKQWAILAQPKMSTKIDSALVGGWATQVLRLAQELQDELINKLKREIEDNQLMFMLLDNNIDYWILYLTSNYESLSQDEINEIVEKTQGLFEKAKTVIAELRAKRQELEDALKKR